MSKKIISLLALIGFGIALTGCNTVAGVGADVKATGSAVEKAADDTKKKM